MARHAEKHGARAAMRKTRYFQAFTIHSANALGDPTAPPPKGGRVGFSPSGKVDE